MEMKLNFYLNHLGHDDRLIYAAMKQNPEWQTN